MSHIWDLITERKKGKLAKCWLAATLSTKAFYQKFRASTINDINLYQMCEYIENIIERNNETNDRYSLYLSSQLTYGVVKIFSYQTSNLEKDITETGKSLSSTDFKKRDEERYYERVIDPLDVLSTSSAQLHEDINLLLDETDIEIKLKNKMKDAACLEFGALTGKEITFIDPFDPDMSLNMFERTHIRNQNLETGLDMSFEFEKTLQDTHEITKDMSENQKKMSISPIHDDIPMEDQEHRTSFAKRMLPEVTIEDIKSRKSDLLTPQKRQSNEDKHIETPSKRRRLRFEDALDVEKVEIAPIPQTAIVSTAINHSLEVSQNLELVENTALLVERKLQKKKVIADKNIKLSHKTIKKWLNNINAHTVSLNIPNVNMPTTKVLLKAPSINFTSLYKKKCNNSLSALFHMHTVAVPKENTMPMEYGELLEKSTEFTRFEDRTNKTEEMFSELSSALGKFAELSKNVTSEKNITIAMDEFPQVSKAHNMVESIIDVPEVVQTPEITEEAIVPDTSRETFQPSQSSPLTKQELLALLEIHWRNAEIVRFTDVIEPDNYTKNDAVCCYIFLLELHKEKKITLVQAMPYDVLWIKKYAYDVSEDDFMT